MRDGTVHLFDVATGQKLAEVIPRVNFPTAGGDVQIELKVAEILRQRGVDPGPAGSGGLICDSAVVVPPPL